MKSEITDPDVFKSRRKFMRYAATLFGMTLSARSGLLQSATCDSLESPTSLLDGESLTPFKKITHYNNFYEFSTNKEAVAILAQELVTSPWTISIEGEVEKPLTIDIDDLKKLGFIEERIYRLRCVEGWSMVIPWQGVALCNLLKQVKPTSRAKFVEFVALDDPKILIGQRQSSLDWPYTEALRIDEAMHPLTLLATGLYGKDMPKQNGAPARLVVPWKYGFKSIKSIVKIRLVEQRPKTSWSSASPSEYGFYANVNPAVSHPRWSQRREVRIGELKKRRTLPFNGYADQVAHLYRGMDLSKNF